MGRVAVEAHAFPSGGFSFALAAPRRAIGWSPYRRYDLDWAGAVWRALEAWRECPVQRPGEVPSQGAQVHGLEALAAGGMIQFHGPEGPGRRRQGLRLCGYRA
jgi:hypothetical protein